ncbi:MAG: hypothetical protein ACKOOL_14040 [Novosphingobium sp.]
MLKSSRSLADLLPQRLRERGGERLTGAVLALLVEVTVLLLALLALNLSYKPVKPPGALVSVSIENEQRAAPEPAKEQPATKPLQSPQPARVTPDQPVPDVPVTPPTTPPPAIIPIPSNQMAQFDLRSMPKVAPAAKPKFGPADTGSPGDSKRVGTAPNGQPLYAAAWYREPYDSELAGYLSTADGPGWGLIACRTVPEFRVEDCVSLDEYPSGSRIARAALAAAWQFRVRPPRLGGVSKYGEWVRIRIDYGVRPN